MIEFKPIACVNLIYKFLTKLLASIISEVKSEIIVHIILLFSGADFSDIHDLGK